MPAWHEQLGHVKLLRTTAAEREERKKLDKREKKERDEEEERNRTAYNFVKYSLGLRHQVIFEPLSKLLYTSHKSLLHGCKRLPSECP